MALIRASWFVVFALPLLGQVVQQPLETQIFKSESVLVIVDVIASDSAGVPVSLKSQDWHVYENGRERPITSVDQQSVAPATPTLETRHWNNNRTGTQVNHRGLSIIFLDSLNMTSQDQLLAHHYILEALHQLSGGERFMLFLLSGDLKQISGTTDDVASIEKLLNTQPVLNMQLLETNPVIQIGDAFKRPLVGDPGPGIGESFANFSNSSAKNDAYLRAKITLTALTTVAKVLGKQPGRKSLIWLTGSFPVGITSTPDQTVSHDDFTNEIKRTAGELAAARVAVYPVLVNSLVSGSNALDNAPMAVLRQGTNVFDYTGTTDRQASADTARITADQTGGRATINSNDIVGGFKRAVADTDSYYTISFAPESKTLDGAFHPILIRTDVPGIQLQYRHGYVSRTVNSEHSRDRLREALDLNLPVRDEIELAARYFQAEPSRVELHVSTADVRMEAVSDGRKHASLLVGYVVAPRNGREPEMSVAPAELDLDKDQLARAEKQGLVLSLRPQQVIRESLLRVGLLDLNSQRLGTLDVDITSAPRKRRSAVSILPNGRLPDPEDGILSGRTYRNLFFDFSLKLPVSTVIRKERIRLMPSGTHALLALSFERDSTEIGSMAIYATENAVAFTTDPVRAAEREAADARAAGANTKPGMLPNSYSSCLSSKKVCTAVRFFSRSGFLLKFLSVAQNEQLVKELDAEINTLRFLESPDVRGGTPYTGPTVPTRIVEEALASTTPGNLAAGGVQTERIYSNTTLGISYGIPVGWSVVDHYEGGTAFERLHATVPGTLEDREHRFFQACSVPLLYLRATTATREEPNYLVLVSITPKCLGIDLPRNWNDKAEISGFAESLVQLHEFGEVASVRSEEIAGKNFLVIKGEIAFQAPIPGMMARRPQDVFLTAISDHLLAWFLISEKSTDLQVLPGAMLHFTWTCPQK
jgi:VWFA-related protein